MTTPGTSDVVRPFADRLLLLLFFIGVGVGAYVGIELGDPSQWKKTTPQGLALTSACVASIYLLLVAWQDELSDGATVVTLKRLVELLVPAVLLGTTFVSAVWTVSGGGSGQPWRGIAVVAVAFAVIAAGVAIAAKLRSRLGKPASAAQRGVDAGIEATWRRSYPGP